ncbi:hypothetical protein WDW86_03195, partial [Bdellovibrionota bacterium FG-2]
HQMVFTIPGRMTSFFVVLHSPNMRHRSPKGEGFSDPGGGTLNEIFAANEYAGHPIKPLYYKSARGGPIDLVWGDALVKISVLPKSQLRYDERPLLAAQAKLKSKHAILAIAHNDCALKDSKTQFLPWTYWS